MSGSMEKSLAILEFLVAHPEGVALARIATHLNQSRSGCHRTLQELVRHGSVRPGADGGEYALTTKLAAMGLSYLGKSGVTDIAQPVIRRLAEATGELVRLALVDGERLTLVAKAQGARSGLLYDPDMGIDLRLSCSAAGQAWLMTLEEDEAIERVSRQGLGRPADFGPNAPTSIKSLLAMLAEHRARGWSQIQDVYAPGMSSMAAPVQRAGERATAIVVVAGPSQRLTAGRMSAHGAELLAAARELAETRDGSHLLRSATAGTWGNAAPRAG
jgi:IclR family transcriptional regulator, acetate operon repressor